MSTEQIQFEKEAQEWMDKLSIFDVEMLNSIVFHKLASQRKELREAVEKMKKTYVSNKIKCNCDCGGPFCDNLRHHCLKPKEHYPQREEAVVVIRNDVLSNVLALLEEKE